MMDKKNEDRIKNLLSEIDKEFCKLAPHMRAKFAIEQISVWQQRFNEAKYTAVKENVKNFVDATHEFEIISESPEIEA